MMTESERLLFLINNLCGGNQAVFSRVTGMNKAALNRIVKESKEQKTHITEYYVQKIAEAFPQVNPQFLRDGETYPGDLTLEQVRNTFEKRLKEKDAEIERLRSEVETLQKVVNKLLG